MMNRRPWNLDHIVRQCQLRRQTLVAHQNDWWQIGAGSELFESLPNIITRTGSFVLLHYFNDYIIVSLCIARLTHWVRIRWRVQYWAKFLWTPVLPGDLLVYSYHDATDSMDNTLSFWLSMSYFTNLLNDSESSYDDSDGVIEQKSVCW